MSESVTHIVVFRVPDRSRVDGVVAILERMRELSGVSTLRIERDLGFHPPAYQLLLVTTHESPEALAAFRADPRHALIVADLAADTDARVSLDYRTSD